MLCVMIEFGTETHSTMPMAGVGCIAITITTKQNHMALERLESWRVLRLISTLTVATIAHSNI